MQPRPGVTGKPVRLAEPPPLLAGREELLAGLDARLTEGEPEPRIVALCGFGGIGKTSVAVAYARRHLPEVGLTWQFAAYDPTVLEAEFGELAAQLGARDVIDTRDPVASVHGMLAAFPAPWLLVFDNVRDQASVERFLPPDGSGRVLITSQNPHWPHGQAIQVPVLETEPAADFLVERSGDQDSQAAWELADEMDGLPLALEQAAAYILATGGSLARYLDSFQNRRAEMLARGEPAGYRGTVATTWSLAFERLQQSDPGAVGLLRLLAFCAPEAIPLRLLLQSRPGLAERLGPDVAPVLVPMLEDDLAVDEAVAALRQYSLVSLAEGLVSVHRLVQAVTEDQMPGDLARQWREATAALVEAALPADPRLPAAWPDFALLLPHAQVVLLPDSFAMGEVARYLGHSGSYGAARDVLRTVLEARERTLGPEDPSTLNARHDLALWTGMAGDAAAARDQFAELLLLRERILAPEDSATLATRSNLADWTGRAGDAAAARELFAELLPIHEQVLGPEHPATLSTRHNLAGWTGAAGDLAAARRQFAKVLTARKRVLGHEHPETLITWQTLADVIGQAGDAAAARDQLVMLLAVRTRVLGAEHPDTLLTRHNLAGWTAAGGDAAAAKEQLSELVPLLERVLGHDHPLARSGRDGIAFLTEGPAEGETS